MMPLGDSHNFGQRVFLDLSGDPPVIVKPRTVYWEFLFLDVNSPLRTIINSKQVQHGNAQLNSILGSVNIETTDNYQTGKAKFISRTQRALQLRDLKRIGELTALALVFGITDLHSENVLVTNDGLQLVDIECLFWDSHLPSESLLLPATSASWATSALGFVIGAPHHKALSTEQFDALFSGFYECMEILIAAAEPIRSFLKKLNFSNYPIRIILRNTSEYRLMLDTQKFPNDLLTEEKEQLVRGDIPYFFGLVDHKEIYYYDSSDLTSRTVNSLPPAFADKVKRAFQPPSLVLASSRLQRIFKQGLIEISYKFLSRNHLPFENKHARVFIQNDFLNVQTRKYGVRAEIRK